MHIEKPTDHLDIGKRVRRRPASHKLAACTQRHWQEQLIRQMLAHRCAAAEVVLCCLDGLVRHRFGCNAGAAECYGDFSYVLRGKRQKQNIAGPVRPLFRARDQSFLGPFQAFSHTRQLTLGDMEGQVRHNCFALPRKRRAAFIDGERTERGRRPDFCVQLATAYRIEAIPAQRDLHVEADALDKRQKCMGEELEGWRAVIVRPALQSDARRPTSKR